MFISDLIRDIKLQTDDKCEQVWQYDNLKSSIKSVDSRVQSPLTEPTVDLDTFSPRVRKHQNLNIEAPSKKNTTNNLQHMFDVITPRCQNSKIKLSRNDITWNDVVPTSKPKSNNKNRVVKTTTGSDSSKSPKSSRLHMKFKQHFFLPNSPITIEDMTSQRSPVKKSRKLISPQPQTLSMTTEQLQ